MDILKDWALCLIAAAAAGTLATVVVPRGTMDKTVRAVVGIFVVAVICSPLAKLDEQDLFTDVFSEYEEVFSDNSYTQEMQNYMIDLMKETVNSEIKETADELGAEIKSVVSDISVDDKNCINIHKINVVINKTDFLDKEELSDTISERLGVPVSVTAE
ncbi:MAG: stage III sporulation protein AF [Clostridia bacterium]|nr:stage III sporulation protein AF [Clostridia bacterium]